MQNLQKSIWTNAEFTKVHSDKCRTYKSPFGQMQNLPFGQMQNLQKSIRTNAEFTKVHSDKCRIYKSPFGQMQNLQKSFGQIQNLQKSIRTNAELTKISKKFGQMHAPLFNTMAESTRCWTTDNEPIPGIVNDDNTHFFNPYNLSSWPFIP